MKIFLKINKEKMYMYEMHFYKIYYFITKK